MLFVLILVVFFSFNAISYPQIDTSKKPIDLEDLLEDASADKEDLEYYDLLEYLSQNRIRLNSASVNDLVRIPYLSRQIASAIIHHRNLSGGIRSPEQLSGAEGISPDLIERILPFIDFEENHEPSFFESLTGNFKNLNLQFRTRIINDLQKKEAYKTGKYDGSNLKLYNRLIIRKDKKLRIGILTEKDPGEKQINDFTTFHLFASDIGFIKNIAAGDYLFEFGQGLALWSRYSTNKGIETVRLLPKGGKGIIPYLSTDEYMFLRGGAVQLSIEKVNLYAFISDKKLDGSLDLLTDKITSIRLDGFHRNQNESGHRKIISEKIFGLSADYSFGEDASLGILYYSSEYGNSFKGLTELDPSGSRFSYLSAGYNILLKRLSISGESSFASGPIATITNAEFNTGKNFSLLFSFRHYPVKYWGLHANGFGEKDGTQNETGFYSGLKLKTDFGILHFYYDQFKFPYTSEKIPFSSGGSEYLFYYTVKPLPDSELRIRYTLQNKDEPTVIADQYGLTVKRSENIRLDFNLRVTSVIQLKSRINFAYINSSSVPPQEKGFLIFEEIKYSPLSSLNFTGRVIFFRTDSYNSRLYEFENDLPGIMTNPPLYGEGMRWYFTAQYRTRFGLSLALKYSELYKPGERSLGSGDSEIKGNIDNRLSIQIDFNF